MRHTAALLALAFAFALAFAVVAAKPGQVREDKDKIVLSNDQVSVWFQGKKPMIKVFPTDREDDEDRSFFYKFTQVVEYRDVDGDRLPGDTEIVGRLLLEKASAFDVNTTQNESEVTVTLNLTAPVKVTGQSALENLTLPTGSREATVALVFRIDAEGAHTKWDFIVTSWPFVDANASRLALDMHVTGELDVTGGEASVDANGTTVGLLTWASTAQGDTTSGTAVDVPVRVASKSADNGTRFVFTYDAASLASLVHDPTIGVAEDESAGDGGGDGDGNGNGNGGGDGGAGASNGVPGPGVPSLVFALAFALVLAARRRT